MRDRSIFIISSIFQYVIYFKNLEIQAIHIYNTNNTQASKFKDNLIVILKIFFYIIN